MTSARSESLLRYAMEHGSSTTRGTIRTKRSRQNQQGRTTSAATTRSPSAFSLCCKASHAVTCFLPVLGGLIILGFLYHLLMSLHLTIFDQSISDSMTDVEGSYALNVLVPIFAGSFVMFVVTGVRNVQLKVYFTRHQTYSWTRTVINGVSSLINVMAYIGFIILAINKIDNGNEAETKRHYVGAVTYFVCQSTYGLIHSYLLFQQPHYSAGVKWPMLVLAVAAAVTAVLFGIRMDRVQYEWISSCLATAYVMLFSVLFHIDPVEDELMEYFGSCCCGLCRRPNGAVQ